MLVAVDIHKSWPMFLSTIDGDRPFQEEFNSDKFGFWRSVILHPFFSSRLQRKIYFVN